MEICLCCRWYELTTPGWCVTASEKFGYLWVELLLTPRPRPRPSENVSRWDIQHRDWVPPWSSESDVGQLQRKFSLNYTLEQSASYKITVKESRLNYNFKYTNLNPTWGTDCRQHSFIPQQNNQWLNSNKLHCKMIRKQSSYAKHQTKAY